jgi:hypothetical protein
MLIDPARPFGLAGHRAIGHGKKLIVGNQGVTVWHWVGSAIRQNTIESVTSIENLGLCCIAANKIAAIGTQECVTN